ncbi:MAG: AAA family ATPase [Planctomycetes bacterium]|nr:AAA family ATPase [Planctomycetota bacterium]MBL7146794.1 AAA family ATPase [Phycisphaerae bacterium]
MTEFVNTIFEPDDWVELRALKGGAARKLWSRACELQKLKTKLLNLNKDTWNIHFGPNPRKEYGCSGDESVDLCRCIFVDFDNLCNSTHCSLSDIALAKITEAGLQRPSVVINSGHGVHCYWRLKGPLEPGFWQEIQQRLNNTVDSDSSIQNPERLMRLPGFLNTKSEPYVKCEIVYVESSLVYDVDKIISHLKELPKPDPTTPIPTQTTKRPGHMEHKARVMLYASKWEGVTEGEGRNKAAYKHACQLRRDFDLPDSEAWAMLTEWNQSNTPPLSDVELRQAFENSNKYGKKQVGTKLNQPVRSTYKQEPCKDPLDEMDEYIDGVGSGRLRTVDWPWHFLGEGTQALQPGTLTILSGGPGAAKSLFMMQAVRYWLETGEKVRYYGMEGLRVKYQMRCLSQAAGKSDVTRTSYVKEHIDEVRRLRQEHELELVRFSKCLRVAGDMKADYLDQISAWMESEAKQGIRLIVVDPITLALRTGKAWEADQRFVRELMNIARKYLCNIILVSHPEKGVEDPSLQNLAGGASYGRFSDNVFTLKKHEDETAKIITSVGRCEAQYNQTITIAKAREGSLVGCRLAYEFHVESLCTSEIGIITKS